MLARHVPVSWRYILIQPPTDQRFVSGPFYEDEPEIDARLEVYYHPKISAPAGPEDNQYTLYWENFKELEEMIRADPYDEMDTSWSVLPAQLVEYFSRFKEKDTTWLSIVIESSPAAFEACFKRSWDIALDYDRCS